MKKLKEEHNKNKKMSKYHYLRVVQIYQSQSKVRNRIYISYLHFILNSNNNPTNRRSRRNHRRIYRQNIKRQIQSREKTRQRHIWIGLFSWWHKNRYRVSKKKNKIPIKNCIIKTWNIQKTKTEKLISKSCARLRFRFLYYIIKMFPCRVKCFALNRKD